MTSPPTLTHPTTVTALLLAAETLEGLKGICPVSVYVFDDGALILTVARGDDHARAVSVDSLAAVLGLPTPHTIRAGDKPSYGTSGDVGVFNVQVQAPGLHVLRAVQR